MYEMYRILRARIKAFQKRHQLERDLDEEIAFHLAELLEAAVLAVAGLSCGVACAWAVTWLLRIFLYEVKPTNLATFVSVCAVLLAVAALASYGPAQRAARVDPVTALKWE